MGMRDGIPDAGHFYPRSPRGERPTMKRRSSPDAYFYPRSPRGERQGYCVAPSVIAVFLSTLPARGATNALGAKGPHVGISIHAPREGSDSCGAPVFFQPDISIHAPREGSDHIGFQAHIGLAYFYPRSPRGERRLLQGLLLGFRIISIHAPREGSDARLSFLVLSGGGISIHAPREGSDCHLQKSLLFFIISIHAPREGSDPRAPAHHAKTGLISIHAPREGSDY